MASRFRNEQVQTQRQLLGQLIQRVADLEVPSRVVAFGLLLSHSVWTAGQ